MGVRYLHISSHNLVLRLFHPISLHPSSSFVYLRGRRKSPTAPQWFPWSDTQFRRSSWLTRPQAYLIVFMECLQADEALYIFLTLIVSIMCVQKLSLPQQKEQYATFTQIRENAVFLLFCPFLCGLRKQWWGTCETCVEGRVNTVTIRKWTMNNKNNGLLRLQLELLLDLYWLRKWKNMACMNRRQNQRHCLIANHFQIISIFCFL